jgi:hypothetical protein
LCGSGACGILKLEADFIEKPKQHATMGVERYVEFARLTLVMSMAWNLLYCAEWNLVLMFGEHVLDRIVLKHVILALVVSYFTMIIVFSLDVLANKFRSPIMKKSGKLLGKSFGLSVAFSWEITFDVSVSTIADTDEFDIPGSVMKVAMAMFLIALVAPAWMKYILPNAMEEPDLGFEDDADESVERQQSGSDESLDSVGKFVAKSVQTESVQTQSTDIDGSVTPSLSEEYLAHLSDDGRNVPVVQIADAAGYPEVDTVDPLTGLQAKVVDVFV